MYRPEATCKLLKKALHYEAPKAVYGGYLRSVEKPPFDVVNEPRLVGISIVRGENVDEHRFVKPNSFIVFEMRRGFARIRLAPISGTEEYDERITLSDML
jgi:hypothetical protein